jgi:hypothetical protein
VVRKLSFCIILLLLIVVGCKEEITPQSISDLIFQNGVDHAAIFLNSQFYILSNEEILILENSIKNGCILSKLANNDLPDSNSNEFVYIDLVKKNKSGVDIFYNLKQKYILLPAIQVHEGKKEYYKKHLEYYKKYLNGTYKLFPSMEIEKMILKLKNAAG